jgi:hypothetical protein
MGSEIHFADIRELCSSQYQLSLFLFLFSNYANIQYIRLS